MIRSVRSRLPRVGGYFALAALVAAGCASESHKPAADEAVVDKQEAPAAQPQAPKSEILAPSAMDQVTEAILDGRPIPAHLEPDVPSETGDDAEACREAKQAKLEKTLIKADAAFARAHDKAASKAMRELLKKKELPAACPDFIPTLDPNLS